MKKTLLIIDVQQYYQNNFGIRYLNKLNKFLDKNADSYNEVACMIDFTKANLKKDLVPQFILNKSHYSICKAYNSDYCLDNINKSGVIKLKKSNSEKMKAIGNIDLFKKSTFICNVPSGAIIGQTIDSGTSIDFIDKELLTYLKKWKRSKTTVHLVGGGLDKCVKKTKEILDIFGINSIVLEDFCYDIKARSRNKRPIDLEWAEIPNHNQQILDFFESKDKLAI